MTDGIGAIVFLSSLALLFVLRCAHRNWGTAIIATVFAPLVIVPMGFVAYLTFAIVLRGINSVLSFADLDMSRGTTSGIATTLTVILGVFLLVLYCRDQRSLSLIKVGPRLGTPYQAPEPKGVCRRRFGK